MLNDRLIGEFVKPNAYNVKIDEYKISNLMNCVNPADKVLIK